MAGSSQRLKVVPIEKGRILRNTKTDFAVYELNPKYPLNPPGTDHLLVAQPGAVWQSGELQRLHNAKACFVEEKDVHFWNAYVAEHSLVKAGAGTENCVKRIEDIGQHLVQSVRDTKLDDGLMSEFRVVAVAVVDTLKQTDNAVKHIQTLVAHSAYTYYHSVGVSIIASSIARELGEKSEDALSEIALGGLLHDLGKSEIPESILCAPRMLTPSEWKQMREHAAIGLAKLKGLAGMSDRVVNMVGLHHERMNGHGYPGALKGEAIPVEARIAAVADIYSALTTTRPYKPKRNAYEALMLMKHSMKEEIWAPALDALVKILSKELGVK